MLSFLNAQHAPGGQSVNMLLHLHSNKICIVDLSPAQSLMLFLTLEGLGANIFVILTSKQEKE